jgi:hypothetical protein
MKKIFTLLVAVGFITAINAQTGSRDRDNRDNRDQQTNQRGNNRDVVINDGRYDNDDRFDNNAGSYNGNIRMQIAQINRKYDIRIDRVRDNRFMRRYEKMRMIRSLEEQRKQEIRMAYARSNKWNQREQGHDRGYDSNHRY